MQLFPILLVAVVLAADSGLGWSSRDPLVGPLGATLVGTIPIVVILLLTVGGLKWCERCLQRGRTPKPIITADRILHFARWLLIVAHAVAVLVFGWLHAVRQTIGDSILLDELVTMLPVIVAAVALWWAHYPIERRLREALLLRRLDLGKPVYAIPTRPQYVVEQVRTHLLLLLVPVLIILALAESIRMVGTWAPARWPDWSTETATFAAGLGVFMVSPLLARLVLNVTPLAEGAVRDDLSDMCRRHRVRFRELLLWKTHGSMINAAVMGLIGPLRFVLLTDALLDTMTREQVQAVMAHEIGHVRRHHIPWLVTSLLALLVLASVVVSVPAFALGWMGLPLDGDAVPWVDTASTIAVGVLALLSFGWLSRRYERQADTFAVQHLSGLEHDTRHEPACVTVSAVTAMQSALDTIARLNTVDPNRRSWRHGSIAWRQAYLASIIGRPIDALPIDRLIRMTKWFVLAVVLLGGAAIIAVGSHDASTTPFDTSSPTPVSIAGGAGAHAT